MLLAYDLDIEKESLVMPRVRSQGFSLLELSIVIVVIALIAGGIIAGTDMLRQSEVRSVISDLTQYASAVRSFNNRYESIPGDMRNATDYWGEVPSGGCPNTVGSGKQTCNGNGNGLINMGEPDASSGEHFRFWQHLSNATLVQGSYTGVTATIGVTQPDIGVNIPASQLEGVGFYGFSHDIPTTNNTYWWYGRYDLTIGFGALCGAGATTCPAFTTAEAYLIDSKLDDGLPGLGFIRIWKGSAGCVAGLSATTDQKTAVYDLGRTERLCGMAYTIFGLPTEM